VEGVSCGTDETQRLSQEIQGTWTSRRSNVRAVNPSQPPFPLACPRADRVSVAVRNWRSRSLDSADLRRLRFAANMANMNGATLGEVVHNARIKLGLKLREVTTKLDITPSYLSDIENDRRVPSEDVLGRLAAFLSLDVDDLMAMAGRVGDQAERYLKHHPTAGVLFRRISDKGLQEDQLQDLLRKVDKLSGKKGP
jgi:transcriptional regulator with XRE-family HTH domain